MIDFDDDYLDVMEQDDDETWHERQSDWYNWLIENELVPDAYVTRLATRLADAVLEVPEPGVLHFNHTEPDPY